ncbi:hypothetical protein P9G84_13745 [Brevibacillus centrosporus]|jgi:hypothetical protein|uniref:hypothetical protein n=1 Tax=Brevibacillus centrosporus TaxID=54910 RepID=UPI0011442632|nr:hypothetical protein [Brevibacillus centrosporus]MEC2130006.1 hypothetical protein [Brevibacillus centrosporus]GED32385.1 hypothetical protein BCE02nite_35260 [Brevibacillus centrosporus]
MLTSKRNEQGTGFLHRFKGKIIVGGLAAVSIVGAFFGGIYVNESRTSAAPQQIIMSDVDWAKQEGLITQEIQTYEQPLQGDFLRMVMTQFGDISTKNVDVPEVKDPAYKAVYESAKFYGVIPCGCKIQPMRTLSLREGAEFVMYAINKKTGQHVVTVQDIESWVGVKDGTVAPLNYDFAAKLLRKMDEVYASKNYVTRGGILNEKTS